MCPLSVQPTRSSCGDRLSGSRWRPKCGGILRSANCAVKSASDPHKEVILVISFGGHKTSDDFIDFAKNKNYDDFEKNAILLAA